MGAGPGWLRRRRRQNHCCLFPLSPSAIQSPIKRKKRRKQRSVEDAFFPVVADRRQRRTRRIETMFFDPFGLRRCPVYKVRGVGVVGEMGRAKRIEWLGIFLFIFKNSRVNKTFVFRKFLASVPSLPHCSICPAYLRSCSCRAAFSLF